jgi:DNA-binding beta-propeller fold protein YncE/mono/diheme cytochrome c family protein
MLYFGPSGRGRSRRFASSLFGIAFSAVAASPPASAQTPLVLSADTQLPAIGAPVRFDLDGAPGSHFQLKMSLAPRETDTIFGTVFLDLATLIDIRKDVLDAAGHYSLTLKVPRDPALVGQMFYFEAVTKDGTVRSASNALALRIEATAPTGARHPVSLAVSPDGSRAFALNEADNTVSVLDPTVDAVLRVLPVSPRSPNLERSPRIAVDPEGRHAFVVNPALASVTVIHAATASIAALIPVPLTCRAIAFDFAGPTKRVFVTCERDQAILVFEEATHGTFVQTGVLPLQGRGPALLAVLPDRKLLVGQQTTLEMEVVDPDDVDGDPTVARIPLGSRPLSFAITASRVFVPTFTPSAVIGPDGVNEVLEFDPTDWTLLGRHFADLGTNYFAAAATDNHLLVLGAASGSLLDANPADLSIVSVFGLVPDATQMGVPSDVALVPPPGGGAPDRAYVLDRFRETVTPIRLSDAAPMTIDPEIALARAGAPLRPLLDLPQVERGEFLFASVQFFHGTPQVPNPVSCTTCHQELFSDSVTTSHGRNSPGLFALPNTAPYGWGGDTPFLVNFPDLGFLRHARLGGDPDPQAADDLTEFLKSLTKTPVSPFRAADGSLSEAALRGQTVFNDVAGCAVCHAAPGFIPPPTDPTNVDAGVGTGLAPVNVPTLLGLWATAPYLHDGSAPTLFDVLDRNVEDLHGTTSALDAQQRSDLIEFLKSL